MLASGSLLVAVALMTDPVEAPPVDVPKITSAELVAAYSRNAARVDEGLQDRLIEVVGTVEVIERESAARPGEVAGYVALIICEPAGPRLTGANPAAQVVIRCRFPASAREELASYDLPAELEIRGVCRGAGPNRYYSLAGQHETVHAGSLDVVDCDRVRRWRPRTAIAPQGGEAPSVNSPDQYPIAPSAFRDPAPSR